MQTEFSPRKCVVEAELRPATKAEVRKVRGGIVWRLVTLPWTITCKIAGTFDLYRKGTNALLWDKTALQFWGERVAVWLGMQKEDLFVKTLPTYFLGTRHFLDSEVFLKEFFNHHRNDDLFGNSFSFLKLLEIVKQVFPEDKFTEEDFMMTCTPDGTKKYRAVLHKLLSGEKFREFTQKFLPKMVDEILKSWETKGGKPINVSVESQLFTSRVICKFMFGEDAESYKIADAVDFINQYILKSVARRATSRDQRLFEAAKVTFSNAVEKILHRQQIPLFEEQKEELSLAQKKAIIFLLFFAGQETTASLLTYVIRLLALDPVLQENIYKANIDWETSHDHIAEIKELFNRAICESSPAYCVGRKLEKDAYLRYRLNGEKQCREQVFYKGEMVVARMWTVAKEHEGDEVLKYSHWSPFGGGPHHCPGEKLTIQEITQFVAKLALYEIDTDQKDDIPHVGQLTRKLAQDFFVTIKRRVKPELTEESQ